MPKVSRRIQVCLPLSADEALDLQALATATARPRRALVAEAVAAAIEALPGSTRDSFERLKRALRETPKHSTSAPASTASA